MSISNCIAEFSCRLKVFINQFLLKKIQTILRTSARWQVKNTSKFGFKNFRCTYQGDVFTHYIHSWQSELCVAWRREPKQKIPWLTKISVRFIIFEFNCPTWIRKHNCQLPCRWWLTFYSHTSCILHTYIIWATQLYPTVYSPLNACLLPLLHLKSVLWKTNKKRNNFHTRKVNRTEISG